MAFLRLEIRRLARSPALHFLVLGGSLYLLRAGLTPPAAAPRPAAAAALTPTRPAAARAAESPTVIVSAAQIERLREAWRRSRRSLPSAAEEARLLARLADEEMLYREALRRGLDRAEPVRRRLIQNMRFLKLDEGGGSRGDLYAQAVEIGFDRTDPVVKRFLVQQMQLLARAGDRPDAFTDAELEDHLRRNLERFSLPAFVRISHVFQDADRRGEALERDARRILARLRTGHVSPQAAPELGDPFFPGHHPALAARGELAKIYGPDFAATVMRLPVGEWCGPVRSAYGLHLVWVHERLPGEPPQLADVRSRLALELAHERQEARLAAYLRDVRRRYEVRIELPAAPAAPRREASR